MYCKSCGAPLSAGPFCHYCGARRPVEENKSSYIKVIISGDMNNITFKKGIGLNNDFKINSDMSNHTYYTMNKIKLYVSGDMNNITFKEVEYSIEKNKGDMNNIE
jgi:hypothetical protein